MNPLDRKLWRDLLGVKTQAIAIALVIGCGIAAFVMALTTVVSLKRTRSDYYEQQRFAHVFAHLKRAPNALAERIADIPGVAQVQTRVLMDVTLDMPEMKEPVSGRLLSISETGRQGLHELYLRRGRWIERERPGEVIVSESFANAHSLKPGGSFHAVINGRRVELHVVGTALSPEYIYEVRPGELLPDNKRFGVIWMGYGELSQICGLDGSFNEVSLTLMRGASEQDVLRRLDLLTAPYGGVGAYGRGDQISHRMVSDEITQMRAMATIPPAIFLGVAGFLLNVVLARLISTQREQIAVIKAFGYSGREIGWHYVKLAGVISLIGVVIGCLAGAYIGHGLTVMYARFFRFPVIQYSFEPWVVTLSIGISLTAATLSVWTAVRSAVKLPPAEAMRPEAPPSFRSTVIEKIVLRRGSGQGERMTLRNLAKRPVRTALSILGIGMSVAVLILGTFSEDLVNHVMDMQFQASQRQDFTVSLVEPASPAALDEIKTLPGVKRCEVFRSVPVRVRAGSRWRKLGLTGFSDEREIFPLLDMDLKPVPLDSGGITISEKLAEVLHVKQGDTVHVEMMEGRRLEHDVIVTALVKDFSGVAAYMPIEGVWHLLGEGPSISGAHLSADTNDLGRLYRAIKDTPRIASVTSKGAMLLSFRSTMAENLLRMKLFNVVFACIIAFGVVYNSARIAMAERSREFATLRVLGFKLAEVSRLMLGEVGTVTAAGLPLGLVLGYGFALLAVIALETESQRFPLVIYPATYAFALSVIAVASVISGLVVRRKLDKLDMIAVLKARD